MSSLYLMGIIGVIFSALGGYVMHLFSQPVIKRKDEIIKAKDEQLKAIAEDQQFTRDLNQAATTAKIEAKKADTERLAEIDKGAARDDFETP